MTNFTSFNKKTLKSWLIPTIYLKKMLKIQEKLKLFADTKIIENTT